VLAGEHASVRTVGQRHTLRGLLAVRARGRVVAGVTQADERLPAEIGDQERDVGRAKRLRQVPADDVCGGDWSRILTCSEQLGEVQARRVVIRHH
jgi:hypothetical protein